MSFEDLGVDGMLEALSAMNAQSLARIACTHRLGAIAAHEAQQKPSLLVVKGSIEHVTKELRERLAARPNIAFLQYISGTVEQYTAHGEHIKEFLKTQLPRETIVLGACTDSLLCALHRECAPTAGTVLEIADESSFSDHIALLVARLPEANANVFTMANRGCAHDDDSSGYSESGSASEEEPAVWEEVDAAVENSAVQATSQDSQHEHGAANSDWLSSLAPSGYEGQAENNAAADIGVERVSQFESNQSKMQRLLSLDPAPSIVVIQDASGDRGLVKKIQDAYPQAAIIGGCAMGREIMIKNQEKVHVETSGIGILAISGNAPLFALTSPYSPYTGGPRKAEEDVKAKMALAEKLAADEEHRVLGSLLFTCCARNSSLFGQEACDVLWFQERFPHLPLLGMYAGGEIGPKGKTNSNLQSFERGNAQYQGYTAVFGFFLVPRKHAPSLLFQRAVLHGDVREAFAQLHA